MNRLTTSEKYPHGAEGKSSDKLTGYWCRGEFEATACVEKLFRYEDTVLDPEEIHKAKPLEEWGEEYGDCLWWSFPIEEPPYCGTPLDCDFPDHVTHFTRLVIPQN